MAPKVSIVMLVYNHERFLRQALDSILMQEVNFDYELIVGEDCSSDKSAEILKEYEIKFNGKMMPIYRKKNIGMVENDIDCFGRCRGEYFAYLEGDDYWTDSHKLQYQVDYLDNNLDCVCICHECDVVDIDGNFTRKYNGREKKYTYTLDDFCNWDICVPSNAKMYRLQETKKIIEKYDNEIKKYNIVPADRVMSLLMLKLGRIDYVPDTMSVYRFYEEDGGTNWSSTHSGLRTWYLPSYYYLSKLNLEKIAKAIGFDINFRVSRMEELDRCDGMNIYGGFPKWKMEIQKIFMLLIEPHPIDFYKEYKKRYKN